MPEQSTLTTIIETVAGASVASIIIVSVILTVLRLILLQIPDKATRWFADLFDSVSWAAIVVFMLLRPFVVQTFNIPSESMVNTLQIGDYIMANKMIYRTRDPIAGEIVVFRGPPESLKENQEKEKTYLIKRCMGTPGMKIEIRKAPDGNYTLYRDDKPLNEPYVNPPMYAPYGFPNSDLTALTPLFKIVQGHVVQMADSGDPTVVVDNHPILDKKEAARYRSAPAEAIPPGKYMMMGDNRSKSLDSRFWGLLDRSRVMGRAEFIWLPLNRIRMTR